MIRRLITIACLVALIGWALWSYCTDGIVGVLLDTESPSSDKLDYLRGIFDQWGVLAPVAYALFVTIEVVVAPIPGTLLYLPGGVIFGGFWGGTLALIGNVLGAGLSSFVVRSVAGKRWLESWLTHPKFKVYQDVIERRGLWIVAVLRFNPVTSSDLVSYAAGLTQLRIRELMLGTMIGMAPLCYLQSYLAGTLFEAYPWLVWPLVVLCFLYVGCVVYVIVRIASKRNEGSTEA